jgi:squalene-hopene/tetraprenyl-beta-curcumene cyclase
MERAGLTRQVPYVPPHHRETFMNDLRLRSLAVVVALLGVSVGGTRGEAPAKAQEFPKPAANSADEPLADDFSLARGVKFLDAVAANWTQARQCGTCHTNFPYLIARPAPGEPAGEAQAFVRDFFEKRVAGWDGKERGAPPRNPTEVVATAVVLAAHDARTTGKLHPLTRKALDRMWTVQRKDGAWEWLKCDWPPFEHDDYYGAVFAAVGVGAAPEGYARGREAQEGLAKLKGFLKRTPPLSLHHKAWLLWASLKLDGLMTGAERAATVQELLRLQHEDGGWGLPSLGVWKGKDGRENNPQAASDGYGTGFVLYVLRQAGVPAGREAMRRGAAWLKANQRASGRWFTRSLNTDRNHYISHAGTAFAVMALRACGER